MGQVRLEILIVCRACKFDGKVRGTACCVEHGRCTGHAKEKK